MLSLGLCFNAAAEKRAWDDAALQAAFKQVVTLPGDAEHESREQAQRVIREHVYLAVADAERRAALEERFLTVLDARTSIPTLRFACRQLGRVGSDRAVAALAERLRNDDLADAARYALQTMAASAAGDALRAAVGEARGKTLVGIINSLGERREEANVPVLARRAADKDAAVSSAATAALGMTGTETAAAALAGLKPTETVLTARLACAGALLSAGKRGAAGAVYEALYAGDLPRRARPAVLIGLLKTRDAKRVPLVLEALADKDGAVRAIGGWYAADRADNDELAQLAGKTLTLPPVAQVFLLRAFAEHGYTDARDLALERLDSDDTEVRIAAIRSLRVLGDEGCVAAIAKRAAAGDAREQRLAVEALVCMKGRKINETVIDLAPGSDAAVRILLIRVLAQRGASEGAKLLLKLAGGDDAEVRKEAVSALGKVLDAGDAGDLVDVLLSSTEPAEIRTASEALKALCVRSDPGNRDRIVKPVVKAMKKAEPAQHAALLELLPVMASSRALDAVRDKVDHADEQVRTAALRALTQWPTPDAAADLLRVAEKDEDEKRRILALRGYVSVSEREKDLAVRLTACRKALALAKRKQEKQFILSALSRIADPAALECALNLMGDKDVPNEAAATVVHIASRLDSGHRSQAVDALKRVLKEAKHDRQRRRAADALKRMGEKP